jgi:DNA-binding NarL/FixJ family response regulator
MSTLQVMIVDDEQSVRIGLEYMINAEPDMSVIGTAGNGKKALDLLHESTPDVLLLDIQMPIMNGIDCIQRIRESNPTLPILILTTFNETDYIIRGLANGANGYIIKGLDFSQLTDSIRDVYYGRFVLPSEVAVKLSQHLLMQQEAWSERKREEFDFPATIFTKKEQEILFYLQTRLPYKEIAEQCELTEGTLRNYLSKIYVKLHVNNRNEAIRTMQRYLLKNGSS